MARQTKQDSSSRRKSSIGNGSTVLLVMVVAAVAWVVVAEFVVAVRAVGVVVRRVFLFVVARGPPN